MKRLYRRKGFTLLELMIVVIVIGILATLALPRFVRAVKRARWAGAAATLGAIRSAQLRYYSEHGAYAGSMANLDTDFEATAPWTIVASPTSGIGQVSHSAEGTWTIEADGYITPEQP